MPRELHLHSTSGDKYAMQLSFCYPGSLVGSRIDEMFLHVARIFFVVEINTNVPTFLSS